ncbi:MAG: tRNA adenosine(34) deaminase TadA [Candidatus Marinimicrobia bacterium]|nr:tRNA adenosine(34) deaminase TadA [Candidatus Neomarinimicrobiota bacterium]
MQDLINPFGHEYWMKAAYKEAEAAFRKDEVPVGAVIVRDNRIIARGYNMVETLKDPTAHAEMIAITAACETLGDKRLTDCTLYVTLEPCAMCAGAMLLAKLDTCVYAAADPKAGACDSLYHLCEDPRLNHRVKIIASVLEAPSRTLLRHFFEKKENDLSQIN